jgi:hypothetical protein
VCSVLAACVCVFVTSNIAGGGGGVDVFGVNDVIGGNDTLKFGINKILMDIIEYALDQITDYSSFERLAVDILYQEGHHNIRPLGGVGDRGQDAIEEHTYISEVDSYLVVFQFTIQDRIQEKVDSTITKLNSNNIKYNMLYMVCPQEVSSDLQLKLRDKYEKLRFYERKTFKKILSDLNNAIYYRYFSDITQQALKLNEAFDLKNPDNQFEESLIKSSLLFTFSEESTHARKSILDYLILASIISLYESSIAITIKNIEEKLKSESIKIQLNEQQIQSSLKRLDTKKYITYKNNKIQIVKLENALLLNETQTSAQTYK